MKIVIVSHSYCAAENRKNIDALKASCDVRVVLPDHLHDPILGRIDVQGDREGTYLVFRRFSLPRSQFLLLSGNLGLKAFKPDIVNVEYDPWSVIFWQVAFCRWRFAPSAKVVCTVKKNTYRRLPWPLEGTKNAIARFFLNKVTRFIAVNAGVRTIYEDRLGVPPSRISVIQHLGLDLAVFHPRRSPHVPLMPGETTIGYCGRLDPHKGVLDLMVAIEQLRREGIHLRLKLLGNGSLRETLEAQSSDWLELVDPVPHAEVANFLRSVDVFVMPSLITPDHEEHDGHALLEALSCGVPSIGSTSGVIPEILQDGSGLLFAAGDVGALAVRLREVISDPALCESLSRRAQSAALQRYSVKSIARQKLDMYKRVLQ
jgi:glycosyltransferase involved in cell wall biosynthesis